MDRVRIGCVSYLNTVPMIEGLELLPEAELVKAVPAKLVSMLERDEVDALVAASSGEVFIYPGAAHLFADPSSADFDPEAAELLMERTRAFLR